MDKIERQKDSLYQTFSDNIHNDYKQLVKKKSDV